MKIYFDGVNWDAEHTGPNCFAKRLAVALGNLGHVVADPDDYDIALVFIEPTAALDGSKPFVQRLDGIWFKPEQMKSGMNRGIQAAYDKATSVVWQSEFDKKMTSKWFGARDGHVIHNGIEIAPAQLRSETLIEMRAKYDKIFVCSSNWHPQKRFQDNFALYKAYKQKHPNSCLIVMGNNPPQDPAFQGRDVFYTGSIRHDLCMEVYSIADWMIHLAWLDHCPNVVVEAISQSCPVICSSEGGTAELVLNKNGIVHQDQEPYMFDLVDYDNPPRIHAPAVTLPKHRADPSTVDIVKTAEKYADVLQSALDAPR